MKQNPAAIAALRALCALNIHRTDAEAIIEIGTRLQSCNEDAWPANAGFWHVIDGEDGKQSFWLSEDGTEETAFPRHACEFEKQQITNLRWILRRYPRLAAIHQPDPTNAAITIEYAPRKGETTEPEGIVICAYDEIPPPADSGGILG